MTSVYGETAFADYTADEQPEAIEYEQPSLDLLGLLELGRITQEVEIRGHKIVLRTLTVGEELEVGLLIKEYLGTSEELKAFCTATIAASIVTVDGNPLIMELGPNQNLLLQKFTFLRDNFFWIIVQELYQKYVDLQERSEKSLDELKKN